MGKQIDQVILYYIPLKLLPMSEGRNMNLQVFSNKTMNEKLFVSLQLIKQIPRVRGSTKYHVAILFEPFSVDCRLWTLYTGVCQCS